MENTRNTIQKKIIFNTLKDINGHPTAKEVYETLHTKYSTISRATVFRVLNNLASAGHINKIKILDSSDVYDYITDGHQHIICTKCNRISNVNISFDKNISSEVEEESKYKVLSYNLVFKGICSDCLGKEKHE